MKKGLQIGMTVSFLATVCVPLTGLTVHKTAALVFMVLCVVHTLIHRRSMTLRRTALLGLIFALFFSGIAAVILDQSPWVQAVHEAGGMIAIVCLAAHAAVLQRAANKRGAAA